MVSAPGVFCKGVGAMKCFLEFPYVWTAGYYIDDDRVDCEFLTYQGLKHLLLFTDFEIALRYADGCPGRTIQIQTPHELTSRLMALKGYSSVAFDYEKTGRPATAPIERVTRQLAEQIRDRRGDRASSNYSIDVGSGSCTLAEEDRRDDSASDSE